MCIVGEVGGNWKVKVFQVERIACENVWDYKNHEVFKGIINLLAESVGSM